MKQTICKKCSKEFSHIDSRTPIYCSQSCSSSSREKKRIVIYCKTCDKEMVIKPSMERDAKYCSYFCFENRDKSRKQRVSPANIKTVWDDASLL